MYSVTHRFELVVYRATRKGICPVCGKTATRSSGRLFSQTLSPFNRNSRGEVKTYQEIMAELRPIAKEWQKGISYHAKCEGLLHA